MEYTLKESFMILHNTYGEITNCIFGVLIFKEIISGV